MQRLKKWQQNQFQYALFFKGIHLNDRNNNYNTIYINSGTNTINVNILGYTSIDEWKAYLDENEIEFICALKTPIETDLTAEDVQAFLALHTNKPYTTIFNNAGTGQTVEYVADTKLYIDNKFTELQNVILSTGGNV